MNRPKARTPHIDPEHERMVKHPDETRRELLETAFYSFYEHGYQGSRLDAILGQTGVTKGALYHHFPNKKQLALAVIDEVIRPWVAEHWIEPLERDGHPVDQLRATIRTALDRAGEDAIRLGCPLNNIAQEMAPIDEDFRVRIEGVFRDWRAGIAAALARGQAAGQVRRDIKPAATAAFLVAAFEGGISTVKSAQCMTLALTVVKGLECYIETLRAPATTGSSSHPRGQAARPRKKSRT
jgi:AcrR family transcriptional regulator